MNFKEIREDKEFKNSDSFGKGLFLSVLLAISIIPISKYLSSNPIVLIAYALIGIVAIKYLRVFYNDWTKEQDEIGDISIDNQIEVIELGNNTSVNFNDLQEINIRFNFIKGRNYGYHDVLHNGIAELRFKGSNTEVKLLKFVIEREDQFNHLKNTFKLWYQRGIKIKEEFTDEKYKSICLEPIGDKTYEEIQELKTQLRAKSS